MSAGSERVIAGDSRTRVPRYGFGGAIVALLVVGLLVPRLASATTITYAGYAYAGNSQGIESRFPYSRRYEASLAQQGTSVNDRLRQVVQAGQGHYPFDLNIKGNTQIEGDATLVTALDITNETVSQETFGSIHKLLVQIRAQALIFDFQSKTLLRAYPLSFAYLQALDHVPTDAEIDAGVTKVYEGAQGKDGIFGRYVQALSHATLPRSGGLFVQITHVTIDPAAQPSISPALAEESGAAQTWVADTLDEALNANAGIPVVPYSVGYALGNVMQMRLANRDFILQFPPPDVEISVDLTGVKRIEYAHNAVGTSYIYGAFATVSIVKHGLVQATLEASFKNGEVKAVPVTQGYVDDLPAYDDAIVGLFNKLSRELGGEDTPWLKSATTTPDIKTQLVAARGLLQQCK